MTHEQIGEPSQHSAITGQLAQHVGEFTKSLLAGTKASAARRSSGVASLGSKICVLTNAPLMSTES